MKITFLALLLLVSVTTSAQQPHTVSILAGAETQSPYFSGLFEPYASGWNAGVNYNGPLGKTHRWGIEYGLFFGIAEYNGPSKRIEDYDTMPQFAQYGKIIPPGYLVQEEVYYSNYTFTRLSVGVNYTLKETEKLLLSAGITVAGEIRLKYREHGKGVLVPLANSPNLPVIYYDFGYKGSDNISNVEKMDFLIQPHVDVSYRLNDTFSAILRLAYFQSIYHGSKFAAQVNTGISYKFGR